MRVEFSISSKSEFAISGSKKNVEVRVRLTAENLAALIWPRADMEEILRYMRSLISNTISQSFSTSISLVSELHILPSKSAVEVPAERTKNVDQVDSITQEAVALHRIPRPGKNGCEYSLTDLSMY